jgi:hypothetical protein
MGLDRRLTIEGTIQLHTAIEASGEFVRDASARHLIVEVTVSL